MPPRAPMQPIPCEPPPGLQQHHDTGTTASISAKTRRPARLGPRERAKFSGASQNRNSNSTWKEPTRATAAEKPEEDGEDASRRVFQPYHSMSVPKKRDLEVSYGGITAMTTVMLRNIPNKYTQGSLLQEIDGMGFLSTYNFFYLPMDIHNRTNVGYAFINFTTPSNMQAFVESFTDYKFKRHQSQKIARVSPAHIQGFLENVCHFSSCAVTRSRNSQYRPVVVYHGQLRDLAEILLELSVSTASPSRHSVSDRILAPEVLASLESGAFADRPCRGLNPAAAEFVPSSPTASSLDPCAEEFVPQVARAAPNPGSASAPRAQSDNPNFESDSSFSMAKKGLEQAVSMWLSGAHTVDGQSTEGTEGSGAPSSDESPVSARSRGDSASTPGVEYANHQDILGVSRTILGNVDIASVIEAH